VTPSSVQPIGAPEPPPIGETALKPDTFAGQTVIVTGGGTGLGKAIASEFARLGAQLVIASRAEEHRRAGVDAMRAIGADVIDVEVDLRQPEQVAALFDTVEARFGLADVLINNAAGNFPVPAEDLSPNGWRTVVDIVLNGTFYCCREFGRRHIDAATPGAIVNIGASYAWTGGPGFAHSAAAKAGVKNLTESLAVEWGPYGIRVNGLVPGLFPHVDETADIMSTPGRGTAEARRQPAHRVGRPHELGWAATFLASPYASFVNGHTMVVDGANWQRRAMAQPEVTPIRDQMGKDPFTLG
jgi:NAD(P)-dependent dehydrogenase (short-subunit alcohol dehydrogenase family)